MVAFTPINGSDVTFQAGAERQLTRQSWLRNMVFLFQLSRDADSIYTVVCLITGDKGQVDCAENSVTRFLTRAPPPRSPSPFGTDRSTVDTIAGVASTGGKDSTSTYWFGFLGPSHFTVATSDVFVFAKVLLVVDLLLFALIRTAAFPLSGVATLMNGSLLVSRCFFHVCFAMLDTSSGKVLHAVDMCTMAVVCSVVVSLVRPKLPLCDSLRPGRETSRPGFLGTVKVDFTAL